MTSTEHIDISLNEFINSVNELKFYKDILSKIYTSSNQQLDFKQEPRDIEIAIKNFKPPEDEDVNEVIPIKTYRIPEALNK